MKERINYVSNSSSSSFVVIPDDLKIDKANYDYNKIALTFPFFENGEEWCGLFDDGQLKFGWEWEKYRDFESKWNWLVLQAFYGGDEYIKIINDYLKGIHENLKIDWSAVEQKEDSIEAYIDHQSVDAKSTFEKVKEIGIDEFLLNEECYIQNGNDNYCPEDEIS